jgi:hypothetical protein
MREAVSMISIFDTDKSERKSFIQQVLNSIDTGDVNPMQLHYQIKCLQDILKGITESKAYKYAVLDEALKHGNKSFDYKNSEVSIKEAGTKYNYESCNDPKYHQLLNEYNTAKERLDEYQEYLKTIPIVGVQVVDEETGETYKIHRPTKTSTTTVTITLK